MNGVELKENDQIPTLPKDVECHDKKCGTGRRKAKIGDEVAIYYENRIESSNAIVGKVMSNDPFKVKLGEAKIEGWNIGIIGMRLGGEREIICHPNVAYGEKGIPPFIPPNSTIISTVQLKAFSSD